MLFQKYEWKYIERNTETWTHQSVRRENGSNCTTYFVEDYRVIRREPQKFSFGPWLNDPITDERDEDDFGNLKEMKWTNPYET